MKLPSTTGIARASARHPWRVLGFWLLTIVFAVGAAGLLPSPITGEDDFTNKPESVVGGDLLEERLRGEDSVHETVVITSDSLTVDDPAFQQVVRDTTSALIAMEDFVASADNYYEASEAGLPDAAQLVSEDGKTTIIPVTMVGDYDDVGEFGAQYVETVAAQGTQDIDVLSVGSLSGSEEFGARAEEDLVRAEVFGLPVALLVLVVVFGALVAAGLPLVVAIVSIVVSVGLTTIFGQLVPQTELVFNVITMIGLAVGIDYALFIVERYREERRNGLDKPRAIERAGGTATRAVVFSGMTVVIALTGMFLIPITVFKSLGTGAIVVVAVSVIASMTAIPALLSLLGDRIDWPRRRRMDAPTRAGVQNRPGRNAAAGGFWAFIARKVTARPIVSVVLATGLLLAAAVPFVDLNTGNVGLETMPESDVKRAYMILSNEFYAGIVAPVEIVIDGDANDPRNTAAIENLSGELTRQGIYGPVDVEVNETGNLTLLSVPMTLDDSSPEAEAAIETLRDDTIPAAFDGAPANVYVTGDTAYNHDFNTAMTDIAPVVFAFVLGLSFLLLMLAFRSIIVPLKAIVMNMLSVGAAYGLLVLVFQKGIGNEIFGFTESPTITTWIPVFLFCILFGLSMDYHVFLLSRIREHYDRTHDNRESVAAGLQSTGRIITGAAAIMVAVFGAFASGSLVDMQQMGFGLAVAILIDATIIRSVLVPASMTLLGDFNWYMPRWLSWLPDLRVEGTAPTPQPARAPARVPVGQAHAAAQDD